MDSQNTLEIIVDEIENILNDIFLSGFHSVPDSLIKRIEQQFKVCKDIGMSKAAQLLAGLRDELNKRKNSFEYNSETVADFFTKIEFYIENFRNYWYSYLDL